MGEVSVSVDTKPKASGWVWFYRFASLVFLAMGAIGVMYGTSVSDQTLQYVGVVSILLSIYCEVRLGNGEAL